MKQVIIRILAPQVAVFDFVTGEVKDGQFVADTDIESTMLDVCPSACDLVRYDRILGTAAYVPSQNLASLMTALSKCDTLESVQFYPNFLVFNLNCDGTSS